LIVPNPESALNEEAGKLLLEEYDEYAKHASLMTSIHAMSPKIDFGISNNNNNDNNNSNSTKSVASFADTCISQIGDGQASKENPENSFLPVVNGSLPTSPKRKLPEKKMEKAKADKKRSLKRL